MIEVFEEEYDITIEDDDRMYEIKSALQSLRPVERKIFLTYVESGTYSETARQFRVSVPTAKRYIVEIKNKIINKLDDDNRVIDASGGSQSHLSQRVSL